MASIADIFYYYSTYSLLICKPCSKALNSQHTITHFKSHFPNSEYADWLETLSRCEVQPIGKSFEQIKRDEPIPPFSSLNQINGFLCIWPDCQEVKAAKPQLLRHLSEAHSQPRDRASEWIQDCQLQSLSSGRFLFRIEVPPTTLPVLPSAPPQPRPAIGTTPSTRQSLPALPAPPVPQQWAQNILHIFKARVQALEENSGPINIYYSKAEWSAFHSTIGTANFWNSRDLGIVGPLLGDELPKQRAILQLALFLLFRKAEIRVPFLPRQSRADLRSFDHRNPTFKEFRLLQKQESREVYIMVMVKFIQFLLASYQHEVCDVILSYAHFMFTLCLLSAHCCSLLTHFLLTFAYFCLLYAHFCLPLLTSAYFMFTSAYFCLLLLTSTYFCLLLLTFAYFNSLSAHFCLL
jgi:hypothetical protein